MLRAMLIAGALVAVTSGGCAETPPKVAISDVAVFTSLHLLAAEAGTDLSDHNGQTGLAFNGPFTSAQMKRHFETKASDYATAKAHADDLLDGVQSQSAFFQAVQNQLAANIALSLVPNASAPGAGQPPAPASANAATSGADADAKAAFAKVLSSPPNDSPFDQLDRVADFYAGYVVKNLRVRGDSRVIDPATLRRLLEESLSPDPSNALRQSVHNMVSALVADDKAAASPDKNRLILIVFQAQVDPGNETDKWTGLRLTVVNPLPTAKYAGSSIPPEQVRVIRVHPTHTYDADYETFGDAASSAIALAGQASASHGGIGASAALAQSASAEASQRRQYLSRSSKITSVADASQHMFGFNFYPTNIEVQKSSNPFALLFGDTYQVTGRLEGGGRDCAAILVVPRTLASFDLKVSSLYGDVNTGHASAESSPRTVHVDLPEWDPLEYAAATVGAGPTPFAASALAGAAGTTSPLLDAVAAAINKAPLTVIATGVPFKIDTASWNSTYTVLTVMATRGAGAPSTPVKAADLADAVKKYLSTASDAAGAPFVAAVAQKQFNAGAVKISNQDAMGDVP